MGNQKQKWTQDEEDALIAGVEKHGPGKWKNILKDPQFAPFLTSRSNIDLKDKWRNLSVSNGTQGSKEKSRVPKIKAAAPATPVGNSSVATVQYTTTPAAAAASPVIPQTEPSSDFATRDPSENDSDAKNPPRYNAMVIEALSALNDANGSDLNAIVTYIEQKHKVPQNFRRALSTRLRRLVSQGKLEKVQNFYRIKNESLPGSKSPISPPPEQMDAWPQWQPPLPPPSTFVVSNDAILEAAAEVAYRVADAEGKAYLASEAVKELERVENLVESSEAMLYLTKQIYEKCTHGEEVLLTV